MVSADTVCDKTPPTAEEMNHRAKLQEALYQQGERIIENRKNIPLYEEDKEKDEWVHQQVEDDGIVTLA